MCRPLWSDRAPAMAGTSGCSSIRPFPAALARKLGSHILTETMERRPDIGLDSYDRFFPNQDTLPQGGFGNLIALPLQKQPRERGNSVFLDDQFVPYPDQWAFLSTVRRINRPRVEAIVRDAEAQRPNRRRASCLWPRKTMPSRGPRRRRAAAREPPIVGPLPATLWNWSLATRSTSPRSDCPQAFAIAAPPGGISEPGVLQGPGDAAADLRQAAHHRLCRGPSAAHRPAARLPGGRASSCCRT